MELTQMIEISSNGQVSIVLYSIILTDISLLQTKRNNRTIKLYISRGHIVLHHLVVACLNQELQIWCLTDKNTGHYLMVKVKVISVQRKMMNDQLAFMQELCNDINSLCGEILTSSDNGIKVKFSRFSWQ